MPCTPGVGGNATGNIPDSAIVVVMGSLSQSTGDICPGMGSSSELRAFRCDGQMELRYTGMKEGRKGLGIVYSQQRDTLRLFAIMKWPHVVSF